MRASITSAPTLGLLVAPAIVAVFALGVPAAIGLTLALLAWRWGVTVSALLRVPAGPELRLETISTSHFVEKVRWCMDRLGVEYREDPDVGALGVFTTGRTVPRLLVRTGRVTSVLANSSDILRYLWGRYAVEGGDRAAFLQPSPEALALETRLDGYGVDLQRWIYYHVLPHREVTLRAWGAADPRLPGWQRGAAALLYPVLRAMMTRAFRLSDAAHPRVVARIEALLADMESVLSDGRRYLLGDEPSFADITLASLSGLWVQPPEFGAGRADAVRVPAGLVPPALAEEVARWKNTFPTATSFIEALYREERKPADPAAAPPS